MKKVLVFAACFIITPALVKWSELTTHAADNAKPPVTFKQILDFLGNKTPEKVIIREVQQRRVAFGATQYNLSRIKDAGASETLREEIRKVAMGPTCTGGKVDQEGQCVCIGGKVDQGNQCVCTDGKIDQGGQCVDPPKPQCTGGKVDQGGQCVCIGGKIDQGGQCVCPSGTLQRGSTCALPAVKKVFTQSWQQHSSHHDHTNLICGPVVDSGWKIDASTIQFVVEWSQGDRNDQWSAIQKENSGRVCYEVKTVYHRFGTSGKVNWHYEYNTIETR